ncbi:cyanoexosortase A [Oscillatoriales cyanobacterium LEGE 11467]|uniref:Cyanoexosortase A n=1 Tax=Zarconia navalis LEGE 11467 TaxID=1828826 RepID=A0A928Z963_9CYAN|nr:cyanoexosortase A [Zarconia navalis]MBE9042295.1 cyanoexosortase A [Zarconia navalis LEGE 11467]
MKDDKYWLLALAVGLVVIHITLTDKIQSIRILSMVVIFWGAILSMLWDRKDTLRLESNVFSIVFGTVILTLALLKTTQLAGDTVFLQTLPLIFVVGLGSIASGIKGLKQYWRELIAFCILALPGEAFSQPIGWTIALLTPETIATVTAQCSTFLLEVLNFEVTLDGVLIYLPNSVVEVADACARLRVLDFLLRLSILFLFMFPTDRWGKIIAPLSAIIVGFTINVIRISLMAHLAATSEEAFHYWHTGEGSQIFSVISILLFGLVCFWLIRPEYSSEGG